MYQGMDDFNYNDDDDDDDEISSIDEYILSDKNKADDNNIWQPPPELQRSTRDNKDNNNSCNYFPLELTHKDYIHRVMDIIAIALKSIVLEITEEANLPPIPPGNEGNSYFLLKQIKDNLRIFTEKLACPSDALSLSSTFLYELRKNMSSMQRWSQIVKQSTLCLHML